MGKETIHSILRSKIRNAFADVTYPTSIQASEQCHPDLQDFLDLAQGRHWTNIVDDYITLAWGMEELSPQLFHFYLPGFLLYSAQQFFDSDVETNLVCSFTPPVQHKEEWQRPRFEKRLSLLTPLQYDAVALYWKTAREWRDFWIVEEIERMYYWDQFLL